MRAELPIHFPEKIRGASRFPLLRSMISAALLAWAEGIEPLVPMVRGRSIDAASHKKGTDFFTEADTASERIIVDALTAEYGRERFRIFGEESGKYLGDLHAEVTIRIDPIDGTEPFKFGKPTWSIMIGAYVGRGASEHQIASVVYWPEYYNEIVFSLEGTGVFKADLRTGSVVGFPPIETQDTLNDIIVSYWKHSSLRERGRIDEILLALELAGGRLRTVTPAEVKEALETRGRRAMILDGDFTLVDFISYSMLGKLGYRAWGWDGTQHSIDDAALTNRKLVFVPPGSAGETILEIVRRHA